MSKSEKIVISKTIQRKGCQATLAMVEKFVASFNEERDKIQLQVRLEVLDQAYNTFLEIQGEIERHDEPEALDNHLAERVDFENRYCVAKGFLLSKRSVDQHESSLLNTSMSQSQASGFHLRLPKIDLPKFDGDFSRWMSFRDTFQSDPLQQRYPNGGQTPVSASIARR